VALIVLFIICGAILTMSMAVSPTVNAFVEKHVLKLIEAISTLMLWGFWIFLAYLFFVYLGLVDRPSWL